MTSEQIPPSDVELEAGVIADLIHVPGRIETAVAVLEPDDFWSPKFRDLYLVVCDLYRTGTAITLDALLSHPDADDEAVLDVHADGRTLYGQTGFDAGVQRLIELRHSRRSIAALTAGASRLWAGDRPADVADDVAAELSAVTRDLASVQGPVAGLTDSDTILAEEHTTEPWLLDGLVRRLDRVVVVGGEGSGKALDVRTPVLTATRGWVELGDVVAGDVVFDRRGWLCNVTAAHDSYDAEAFEIRFSDGASLVADGDHRWLTSDYQARQKREGSCRDWPLRVRTTNEIGETLRARDGHCLNHSIPTCGPLNWPVADLPVPPYTLGAWLGDGTARSGRITCADDEILDRIRADGYTVTKLDRSGPLAHSIRTTGMNEAANREAVELWRAGYSTTAAAKATGIPRHRVWQWTSGLHRPSGRRTYSSKVEAAPLVPSSFAAQLRALGVFGNKHIPEAYKRASEAQRLELLRGIVDTDGHIDTNGFVEITLKQGPLANDVVDLARSLGWKVSARRGPMKLNGEIVGTRCRISFAADLRPAHLARKAERWHYPRTQRGMMRYVEAVSPAGLRRVRCITVDSPDHSWLAGEHLIPTHNSTLLKLLAVAGAAGLHPFLRTRLRNGPIRSLIVDIENRPGTVQRQLRLATSPLTYRRMPIPNVAVMSRPGGWDLLARAPRLELDRLLAKAKPDLVVIGPAYKLWDRSVDQFAAIAEIVGILDQLQMRHGFGLVIEHHQPVAVGNRARVMRPEGPGTWMRWPEAGIGIHKPDIDGGITRHKIELWRQPRDPSWWPTTLERGRPDVPGSWPFTGLYLDQAVVDGAGVPSARPQHVQQNANF